MTDIAAPDRRHRRRRPEPRDAPPQPGDLVRRAGLARAAALGRADRRRADRARDRARRPPVPPRREPGRVLLLPLPAVGRLPVQPAAARPAALLPTGLMYVLFGDSNFTARLAPVLMGLAMIPTVLAPAAPARAPGAPSWRRRCSRSAPATCTSRASPARTSTSPRSRSRCVVAIWCYIDRPRTYHPAIIGALLAASLRDQGDDVHHGLRDGLVLPVLVLHPGTGATQLMGHALKRAGWEGWGWSWRRSRALFTLLFTTFLTHPGGLWDGIYTGLEYWLDQHGVRPRRRAGGVLQRRADHDRVADADPRRDRRGRALAPQARYFAAFLVWDFFVSLAVYSWAGEKFAWLVLHPLLPVILLAGVGLQAIWEARGALRWVGLARRGGRAALRRRLLVVGQRRPRRQPARDARLHAVLDAGQGRRRPGARAGREPRAGRPAAERDDRLRRGRDVPLRLVLPPPRDRLHRPPAGGRGAAQHATWS